MNKIHLFKASKFDFALVCLVLVFSFGSISAFRNDGANNKKKVCINYNNELVKEIILPIKKPIVYSLKNDAIKIEVNQDRVRIQKADCPQLICRRAGWIGSHGQTIVCAPNRILVEIVQMGGEKRYDAVSY